MREGSFGKVGLDPNNSGLKTTQSDLAKQSNQSVDTWNNAKKLAEAIPELVLIKIDDPE